MFLFRKRYLLLAALLLLVEIGIALFVHDAIVRPYIGDFLAVIFLYCLLRSFLAFRVVPLVLLALGLAFLVEFGQYFHLLSHLGLQHVRTARIVFGNSFSWLDMITYTAGAAAVLAWEASLFFSGLCPALLWPEHGPQQVK